MNRKQLLTAIFVIGLLAIAFFCFGDGNEVVPLSPDDIGQGAQTAVDMPNYNEDTLDDVQDNKGNTSSDEDMAKEWEESPNVETKQVEKIKEQTEDKPNEVLQSNKKENLIKIETEKEKPMDPKLEKQKIIERDNKNKDKKDKYMTDPVPEGKPKPVEWQDVKINYDKELTCTLSVTCKSILNNMHLFNMDKLEVLPEDGVIYEAQTVTFYEGESVFDVLLREMKKNKIHMEFVMTPIYNSYYIEGINNLYEFDCGELSGWMYRVNGWFPNYGCSRYMLKDGDVVEWIYTCDLGRDIGGQWAVLGGEE